MVAGDGVRGLDGEEAGVAAVGAGEQRRGRPGPSIKVTQPRELADYAKAFAGLAEMAVYGDGARALVRAAIDALERIRNFSQSR
ncbi:hypothetical protein PV396_43465 [Streptomyces sp. ME02-8801-2C]|uniref:hypothetical protein n=1 Tax=Streptomyces sp. ME02-8801-2C TaxID=3028680 RepID=UPI0029A5502A|nr:hypothetical protein [Streptomyces sp. ME02-8801-2C]MDX3458710.1 hypothetical protein [Streptomyces sp. ME02-8801-2C]